VCNHAASGAGRSLLLISLIFFTSEEERVDFNMKHEISPLKPLIQYGRDAGCVLNGGDP
jgi:hypothetical protein